MPDKGQQPQQPQTEVINGVEVVFLGDRFSTAVKAVEALGSLRESGASTPSHSPQAQS